MKMNRQQEINNYLAIIAEYKKLRKNGSTKSERDSLAKMTNYSGNQIDRYLKLQKLIPDLFRMWCEDEKIGTSSLFAVATHTFAEQYEIFELMKKVQANGIRLTRDNMQIIVNYYRNGIAENEQITTRLNCYKMSQHKANTSIRNHRKDSDFSYNINTILQMQGIEFEEYLRQILPKNGFILADKTETSYDRGADIIAYRDEISYVFQCKRWKNDIGIAALQEVYMAKALYHVMVAVVVTSSQYPFRIKELANELNIILWNSDDIAELAKGEKYNK